MSPINYFKDRIVLPEPGNEANEAKLDALYKEMNATRNSSLGTKEQARLKALAAQVVMAATTGIGRDQFPELWKVGSKLDGPPYKTVTVLASVIQAHRTAGEPYREAFIVFEGTDEGGTIPAVSSTYCFRPQGSDWRPIKCDDVPANG